MHYALCTLHLDTMHFHHVSSTVNLGIVHFHHPPLHFAPCYGALPLCTVHINIMYSQNSQYIVHYGIVHFHHALWIVHIVMTYVHYALCTLVQCTSSIHNQPWYCLLSAWTHLDNWYNAFSQFILGVVDFHDPPCTFHLSTVHFHYAPYTLNYAVPPFSMHHAQW